MNQPIRVSIIGFGLSGRYFFAPYFESIAGFQLKAIVSSQKELINSEYPCVSVLATLDELLYDSSVDLVVVASPNYTHYEYACKVLNAGKHVLIEKPFTNTVAEAEGLIQLAAKEKLHVFPFQNRRWDAEYLTIKKVIHEGQLGEILEFESHFDRYRPQDNRTVWKNEDLPGNGVLYDLGPHLIDQALSLFGTPKSIYAHLQILRDSGKVVDTVDIQLYYKNLKVILKAGVFVKETGPRMVVHGRKGSFVKYGLDPQEANLRKGHKPGDFDLGEEDFDLFGVLTVDDNGETKKELIKTISGNYSLYFENIRDVLWGKAELIVKPEQVKNVIKVIELANQSNMQRKVIDFD